MILTELIEEFKEASGRIDLSDSDVTKYINRGVKFLDEASFRLSKDVRVFSRLNIGDGVAVLPRECRTVKSVWSESVTKRKELVFVTFEKLRTLYNEVGPVVEGEPESYSFSPTNVFVNSAQDCFGVWADFPGVTDTITQNCVIVYPPTDEQRTLEIIGNFYTAALSSDVPQNWWSINHPEIVIQAAIYRMDNNYRNTQGGKDLLSSISDVVTSIYHDDLETEYNRPSKMEG